MNDDANLMNSGLDFFSISFRDRRCRSWPAKSGSAAFQRLGCRVIGAATTKPESFAITVNEATMGVVAVDVERGAPERGEAGIRQWGEQYHERYIEIAFLR